MTMTAAVCGSSISLNRSKLQRVTTFLGGSVFFNHHSWILTKKKTSLKGERYNLPYTALIFSSILLLRGEIKRKKQRKQKQNISPWIRPSISDAWNAYPFSSISWLRTIRSTPQFWRNSCVTSWIVRPAQEFLGDKHMFCSIQTRIKEPKWTYL